MRNGTHTHIGTGKPEESKTYYMHFVLVCRLLLERTAHTNTHRESSFFKENHRSLLIIFLCV